jgi:mitochondrial import inner membrane translocase subunit TIM44
LGRGGSERVKANPDAGSALVVTQPSAREEAWQRMKETNPLFVKLGELRTAYDESENPVVSGLRSITSTIGGLFEETENAQVVRAFKAIDPSFTSEVFERELREYIVPEVVDAYLTADGESLKKWCSEAVRQLTRFY